MKNDTNFVKEKELGGKTESQMLRNQIGGQKSLALEQKYKNGRYLKAKTEKIPTRWRWTLGNDAEEEI